MNKTTKESLYYQVNKMIDLLTDRDVRSVELMLEGLRKEIQDGIVDTSVAGFNWIPERSEIVDFTQGIFPNVNKIFLRRPTKHDVSLKYFMLGNIIRFPIYLLLPSISLFQI